MEVNRSEAKPKGRLNARLRSTALESSSQLWLAGILRQTSMKIERPTVSALITLARKSREFGLREGHIGVENEPVVLPIQDGGLIFKMRVLEPARELMEEVEQALIRHRVGIGRAIGDIYAEMADQRPLGQFRTEMAHLSLDVARRTSVIAASLVYGTHMMQQADTSDSLMALAGLFRDEIRQTSEATGRWLLYGV